MSDDTGFRTDLIIRAVPRSEIWEREAGKAFTAGATAFALPRDVQLYEVVAPFSFVSLEVGLITVPRGFYTDFGSVSAATKCFVDDDDPDLLFGSLPHDYLYSVQGDLGDGRKLTRYQADCVLKEAMQRCGAPAFKVAAVFAAVRIGGGGRWKQS